VLGGTANFVSKYLNSTDLSTSAIYENGGSVGLGTTTPLDVMHVRFTETSGNLTGYAVQNLGSTATSYSGMLFYDQNGAVGQFQGFNNSTHEYRINNVAAGGTINFMIGGSSKLQVANNGVINFANSLALRAPTINSLGLGQNALALSTANYNIAVGGYALGSATSGGFNTALGFQALTGATTGVANTALGYAAGVGTSTGNYNTAVGYFSGFNLSGASSNNIDIANTGTSTDSGTIRIGNSGTQTSFFVAGVRGVTTSAADAVSVVVDSHGQLGTINSSRRYKEDIQDMGDASSRLMELRPVTYRYKQAYADGSKPIDYGLIAEEVEAVYPDLVAHLADGEVETVQYQKINAMLLNEVQKQHRTLEEQRQQLEIERAEIELLKDRLASLEAQRRQ
jgi:hypothetical protein